MGVSMSASCLCEWWAHHVVSVLFHRPHQFRCSPRHYTVLVLAQLLHQLPCVPRVPAERVDEPLDFVAEAHVLHGRLCHSPRSN